MLTYTIISVIMGNLLTMGVERRIESSVRSGSVIPLWFFILLDKPVDKLLMVWNLCMEKGIITSEKPLKQ